MSSEQQLKMLRRKEEERKERLLQFEAWLETKFDLTKQADIELLNKLYPNYFERRLQLAQEIERLQKKKAEIDLHGFQTKEDLMFMFAVDMGEITIPSDK